MNTIKIPATLAASINDIISTGKTCWVIVMPDYIVGIYNSRTDAREAKSVGGFSGTICKSTDLKLEIVELPKPTPVVAKPKDKETGEVAAKKTATPITHESTIENPCKTVWGIATDMKAANPMIKRGAVLAACVEAGIAYYTARTQYQAWLQVQKEMAEREASQAAQGK